MGAIGAAPRLVAEFSKEFGCTGFWHETYFMRGGIEAIYDDMPKPIGMMTVAPLTPARGGAAPPAVVAEKDLYGG